MSRVPVQTLHTADDSSHCGAQKLSAESRFIAQPYGSAGASSLQAVCAHFSFLPQDVLCLSWTIMAASFEDKESGQ
ncbi:hypothetical protein HPG69_009584 [Diceros bicornis minor]|uniref:Uncharacterized protein n=1 Tax=Diceros bicornis minor TaxID=77932 RepID=A0A7J7EXM5_DICBM|nr:hypothetical protein HPG69_009584 [Diceros bicornis minor]